MQKETSKPQPNPIQKKKQLNSNLLNTTVRPPFRAALDEAAISLPQPDSEKKQVRT